MIVLSKKQLEQVLADLPQYFPHSCQMHTMIRNRLTGCYDWPGTEFVVDEFPNYTICMIRPVKVSADYVPWPRGPCVMMFCKNGDKLDEVLRDKDALQWNQPLLFFALSKNDVFPVVLKRCKELGGLSLQDSLESDHGTMFLLKPSCLLKSVLPDGFRLGELSAGHARQVNSEWRYGSPATLPFFEYILQNDFPTSAVFTADDRLVAYILYQPDGSMGHGYVNPEFRRLGLFQIVNYELANKVVAMGQKIPWVYVMLWNEASQRAYTKLGAKRIDPDFYSLDWIHYSPKRGHTEADENVVG